MKDKIYYINKIKEKKARSKWEQGVKEYALEMLEAVDEIKEPLKDCLLNGAEDWAQYSWGGSSLIYDNDICERLATPSEQKRKKYGELSPNSREEWLDVQARALRHAFFLIKNC